MRYILFLLPIIVHTACINSEPAHIDPASLQTCQNNELEFHKPTIGGVTHWKLIPTKARFQIAQKIYAHISWDKDQSKYIPVESIQEAMQLVESTDTQGKEIEWLFCD